MKKTFKFTLLCLVFISQAVSASDFSKIYERMYNEYMSNPSKTSVESLLKIINIDGSFLGINYQSTDGAPRKHVQNMINLAAAYENPASAYYLKDEVKNAYLKTLNFWITTNHQANNWWFRYIAYPKELSKSVILMAESIKENKDLFNRTMSYLQWSFDHATGGKLVGANGADMIIGSLAASILTNNNTQMMVYKNTMTDLLTIQPVDGIQPDYLFAQHCGSGRQLYFSNYGKEFVNSVMFYLEFCNGTKYQTPGVDLLQDLFANGVQWIFYSQHYDPNNSGRFDNSDIYYESIKSLSDRLLKLKGPRKAEMQSVNKRIGGENSLTGNRMFWRFDYMINRRTNYMVSNRMTSTRTVGNEAGNGDGEYNYYASNGVNYLFVSGKEYDRNYFKKFNNRQFPGITAEQDNNALPIPNWGENGTNSNAFAGGVSDSIYGASAMILDRRGLQAHKAWFYFDDEYVCLGAGITQNNGKADVYTTINQTNYDGKLQYFVGGKTEVTKSNETIKSPNWFSYGNSSYFNLKPDAEYKIRLDTAIFSLNINHGTSPQNSTYAYIVCPGMTSANDADKYQQNIPVKILSNTTEMQAVQHEGLQLIETVFYQPGTLKLNNGDMITVDKTCVLMWNRASKKINIANPYCETQNPKDIKVEVTINGKVSNYIIPLPQGDFAGKSQSFKLK